MPEGDSPRPRAPRALDLCLLVFSLAAAAFFVNDGLDDSIHGTWLLTLCCGVPIAVSIAVFALVRLFEHGR